MKQFIKQLSIFSALLAIVAPTVSWAETVTETCLFETAGDGCVFDATPFAKGILSVETQAETTGDLWRVTIVKVGKTGAVSKVGTGSAVNFTGKVSRSFIPGTEYIVIVSYERPLPGTFPTSVEVRFTFTNGEVHQRLSAPPPPPPPPPPPF